MTESLTIDKLRAIIEMGDEEFEIESLRRRYHIDPRNSNFYMSIKRLCELGEIKRLGRARYKRLKKVKPIEWWSDKVNTEPLDFYFPRSYGDETEFGFEDILEMYPGDLIVLAGHSNGGKTALALSILGENLDLFDKTPVLMGSEYTAADGKISPKFKRRMERMTWVEWVKDGQPRFELYPVGSDYEDYVQADRLNIIDWISLPGDFWMIDSIMKSIKDRLGNGVGVIVLQKNRTSEYGEGGERTERFADVYMTIDPLGYESKLTLGKVKANKTTATGRMWAFSVVDYGANLHNIREVKKCPNCFGKGWKNNKPCDYCDKRGVIDK